MGEGNCDCTALYWGEVDAMHPDLMRRKYVAWVFVTIVFPLQVASLYALVRMKERWALSARRPLLSGLVLLGSLLFYIATVLPPLTNSLHLSCRTTAVMIALGVPLVVSPFVALLLHEFSAAKLEDAVRHFDITEIEPGLKGLLQREQKNASSRIKALIALSVLYSIAALAAALPSVATANMSCWDCGILYILWAVKLPFYLALIVFLIYLYVKMRNVRDRFSIRFDVLLSQEITVVLFLINVIICRVFTDCKAKYDPYWIVGLNIACAQILMCVLPLWRAFQNPQKVKKLKALLTKCEATTPGLVECDFGQMLADPKQAKEFQLHLLEERSVENILFYNSAKLWKERCHELELIPVRDEIAKKIFHAFISSTGTLPVNLSSVTYEKLESAFAENTKDYPGDVFDDAVKEVFGLLRHDSFFRFTCKQEARQASTEKLEGEATIAIV